MATVYGNTANHWRAYMTYSTSESNTAVTISVTAAGFQSVAWGFELTSGVSTSITCTGQSTMSGSGGFYSSYGSTVATSYVTATYTISKSTSAKTVTLGVTTTNSSGYMNGTSTASVSINIPALASYAVTYNANNGTGAPASQTKYYGQTLVLSSAVPTRSGYSFVGWNTSSSATTASYQPGANYTSNAALTLYAVWKLDYIQPTISNIKAVRCNSSGTETDSGTYVKVTGSWKVDTSITSTNKATNLKIEYKVSTASSWTSASSTNPNAASGTISSVIGGGGIATGNIYDIRVTVTDSGGSSSATTQVYKSFATIDIANSGKSVGIGCVASESSPGLDISMPIRFTGSSLSGIKRWQYASVGQKSNTTTNTYYKFASLNLSDVNSDRFITFKVYSGWSSNAGKYAGLLTARVRTNSNGYYDSSELIWEYACDGIYPQNYILAHNTSTKPTVVELWVKLSTNWTVSRFEVISQSDRASLKNDVDWTLYQADYTNAQSEITSSLTQQTSTLATLLNPADGAIRGTSDNWNYVKYNTGWAECWSSLLVDEYSLWSYGSAYYHTFESSFPFTFTSNPVVIPAVCTYGGAGLWNVSIINITTSSFSYHAYATYSSDTPPLYIQLYVKGRWKS